MSKPYTKEHFAELLNELVCDDCLCPDCFLKKFLESLHPAPIVLVQLKCLERFMKERGKELGRELDWNEAGILWATEGWAKAFSSVFDEDLHVKEIYERTKAKIITPEEKTSP